MHFWNQVLTVIPPALFKLRTGIYLQSPGTVVHHSVPYQIVIVVSDELTNTHVWSPNWPVQVITIFPGRTLLVGKCTLCSLTQIVVSWMHTLTNDCCLVCASCDCDYTRQLSILFLWIVDVNKPTAKTRFLNMFMYFWDTIYIFIITFVAAPQHLYARLPT